MYHVYRLYKWPSLESHEGMKKHVDDFDARNSDYTEPCDVLIANMQAQNDMFTYMNNNPGIYTHEVIFISSAKRPTVY